VNRKSSYRLKLCDDWKSLPNIYMNKSNQSALLKNISAKIEAYLENTLKLFPESGTPMQEYGEDIRRLSYQRFSILYRIEKTQIQILTFYRQSFSCRSLRGYTRNQDSPIISTTPRISIQHSVASRSRNMASELSSGIP